MISNEGMIHVVASVRQGQGVKDVKSSLKHQNLLASECNEMYPCYVIKDSLFYSDLVHSSVWPTQDI